MQPRETAAQYDAIAHVWSTRTFHSKYGRAYLERAVSLVKGNSRDALDVGCGGGRLAVQLLAAGFNTTALDASGEMIREAAKNAPDARLVCADIAAWEDPNQYDIVVAWDSTVHLPKQQQIPTLRKLCRLLRPGGVLLFTALGVEMEVSIERDGHAFYYASVAASTILETLHDEQCQTVLLERDQFPENHVAVIALRNDA